MNQNGNNFNSSGQYNYNNNNNYNVNSTSFNGNNNNTANNNANAANDSSPQLSGDDSAALIAAQHAQLEQEGNPAAAIYPPTPYDDQARQELKRNTSSGTGN